MSTSDRSVEMVNETLRILHKSLDRTAETISESPSLALGYLTEAESLLTRLRSFVKQHVHIELHAEIFDKEYQDAMERLLTAEQDDLSDGDDLPNFEVNGGYI